MSRASVLSSVLSSASPPVTVIGSADQQRSHVGYGSAFDAANYSDQRSQVEWTDIESAREIDAGSRLELLRLSRWCANNLPPYAALLQNVPQLVCGPKGLRPFPATKDKEWNVRALANFEKHTSKFAFDMGGKWSFYSAQEQAFRHMLRDGDMGGVLTESQTGSGMMQFYEGHEIGSEEATHWGWGGSAAADKGKRSGWRDGVLCDRHGRAQAYRINGKIIPRQDFLMFVSEDRRGASRGVPVGTQWFTDGLDLTELKSYVKASAKNAARLAWYRKNTRRDGKGSEPTLGAEYEDVGTTEAPEQVLVKEIEGGIEAVNMMDQDLAILADPRPGPNTMEFMDRLVWNLALSTGLPPYVVFFLMGLNPGSAEVRLILQGSKTWFKRRQQWLVENFCQRWWVYHIAKEIKRGVLPRPNDPEWYKCGWICPADMTIDIGREGSLKLQLKKEGMLSLAMWAGELGEWWEHLQDQSLREAARGARRRREIAGEEKVSVAELVSYQKGEAPGE